ncbi:LysR family transcriptional regulator [Roseateles asaccharophilus]|uniref:DNA-binding transcriptional LysR family regulator n=1 Tax=Roseateles asaccharophilus TaxID=582607 RepID=A0ABU2AEC1_9BURK|nr:LysR family transcriptional regulator [Roseateles asaccharophilus]MDR7334812.1 DNA-binding transcriptional LysR family regulator [Roseateles asaccharophilus]
MTDRPAFDKIELYLVRVFHTVITERSVSRAALRLQTTQPAVSAALKRLRTLVGDPLLVRSGPGMAPTDVALELLKPATEMLRNAQQMFGSRVKGLDFDAARSTLMFRIAASDYLDPLFLPQLVARIKASAPGVRIELLPLSGEYDYRRSLAGAEVDLVIGNWLSPPAELHLGRLLTDEVVCLVAEDHPAVQRPRWWTAERYLESEHVAPTPLHPGARGVIDEHLEELGLTRNIAVRSAHFGLAPLMVARSRLVLTTGRQFCTRYTNQYGLRIVRCPVSFPSLNYYQLWHELSHHSAAGRWLREQVRDVARSLSTPH